MQHLIILAFWLVASVGIGNAGEADIVGVKVGALGGGKWRFDVTVHHADVDWEHYANRWEVVGPDGTIFGTRILAHPHVNEQPFTRSGSIDIPGEVSTVTVHANDLIHDQGGVEMEVELPN